MTAIKNNKVKAIVAFEPGSSFVFPEGEVPAPIPSAFDTVQGAAVPMAQFMALTRIPILILYGDNIPEQAVDLPAQDSWRARLKMARLWRDAVNQHGGDVKLIHLPEIGIKGNTHFPMSDLNNEYQNTYTTRPTSGMRSVQPNTILRKRSVRLLMDM